MIWILRWATVVVVVAGFVLISFSLIYEGNRCSIDLCGPVRYWVPLG